MTLEIVFMNFNAYLEKYTFGQQKIGYNAFYQFDKGWIF